MPVWLRRTLIGWILLAAATLRLTGLGWDDFLHYHPDERFIAWVATTIEGPNQWNAAAFTPHLSTFNPYYWPAEKFTTGVLVPQNEPRDFAYGHVPLYLGAAATRLAEKIAPWLGPRLPQGWPFTQAVLNQAGYIEFVQITAVGRVITALFDLGTVWLVYRLGRLLFDEMVGLLAAALLTVTVMHIQLAHFYTVDPFLTFFVVACLYFLVSARPPRNETSAAPPSLSLPYLMLAGVMAGLAVGSKFAAVLLVLPIIVTLWLDRSRPRSEKLLFFVLVLGTSFLAFFLTNPFAILDQTCDAITPAVQIGSLHIPQLNWGSCFLENVVRQGLMANGQSDFGFTRQYAGTTPYLYFLEMQLKWGMGPFLGVAALFGLIYFSWQGTKLLLKTHHAPRPATLSIAEGTHHILILLAWTLPYLLSTGNFYAKFMRYMQPVLPIVVLFAAALLLRLRPRTLRHGAIALVLFPTALYALAFANIYRHPHPWVAASQWIYNNVKSGAVIYSEQWDDPLPTTLRDMPEHNANRYVTDKELTWLTYPDERDTQEYLQQNLMLVAEADYLIISSQRIYGVVPRQPERYPLSSQFHPLLFSGQLGYEPVYTVTRLPQLSNWAVQWDTFADTGITHPTFVTNYLNNFSGINLGRVDESFTVYDQPLPIIFANIEHLTAEQLLAQFDLP